MATWRWLPSWPMTLMVLGFWLLISGGLGLGQILLGAALGVAVPLLARRLHRESAPIGSLRPVPRLLAVVTWDMVKSNVIVAAQVLGREAAIHPGFVWVPLDIGNIHGIAALTSIITLTPGTVSAALTDDRRYLLVHMLHVDDADAAIAQIKTRYEAPLMEIFP